MEIRTHADPAEVAAAVADYVATALGAIAGRATLGLAGGSTPRATYQELVARAIAWDRVTMWLGDERWVAHHHPESNIGMVRGSLVDRVGGHLLAPNHAIGDPHTAAAAYETELRAAFVDRGRGPAPDVILLGIGDDGHTASLFPGTTALEESRWGYVATWVASQEAWRLTATRPLLAAAQELIFIATGTAKAEVIAEILAQAVPYPAQLVAAAASKATWFLDAAAAAGLEPTEPRPGSPPG